MAKRRKGWTVNELADAKGCHWSTVYKAIEAGQLRRGVDGLITPGTAARWDPNERDGRPTLPEAKRRRHFVGSRFNDNELARLDRKRHQGESRSVALKRNAGVLDDG